MTNWRKLVEKDYLGSWDLEGPNGQPKDFTLTITKVESRVVKSREIPTGKRKVVIHFQTSPKPLLANATNCETIESLYGPNIEGWAGKKVTLYATMVRSPKGGQVMGIRVRPTKPRGEAEQVTARPVDPEMRAAQDEAFDGREPGEEG